MRIKDLNQEHTNILDIKYYNMVSKSTKKDISDILIKTVNTACEVSNKSVVCFNKSAPISINYDPSSDAIIVDTKENVKKNSFLCNAYVYKYMGLAFYINRSRLLYARQNKWRENKYDICSSKDINSISSEILSLPQTINLSILK